MKIKKSINNRYFTFSLSSKQQITVLLCVMMLLIRKGYYNRNKNYKEMPDYKNRWNKRQMLIYFDFQHEFMQDIMMTAYLFCKNFNSKHGSSSKYLNCLANMVFAFVNKICSWIKSWCFLYLNEPKDFENRFSKYLELREILL